MDSLTHGLLGLVTAAVRKPDAVAAAPLSPTDRATLLACVLAAELPDLDYLWPASDPVLHALRAHRGITHALVAAPFVALLSAGVAWLVFRKARIGAVYPLALASVVIAHLLADAWTGWGTRLLLPFSDERVTLDWMMVIDPWFSLPLAAAALWALRRRARWRRTLLVGAALSAVYLVARIALQARAESALRATYPAASHVQVFPKALSVTRFRYVATLEHEFVAGEIGVFAPFVVQGRAQRPSAGGSAQTDLANPACASADCRVRELAGRVPTIAAALAWARFPVIQQRGREGGGTVLSIADLRYHWRGEPTLTFSIELDERDRFVAARLERGGAARALFERWRR